ncbi:MAG: glycoside hydrolase family 88 protein [Puniceicoccaceae bacterium]
MLRTLLIPILLFSTPSLFAEITVSDVESALRRTADWQLAHPNENQIRRIGLRQWHMAPLYDGLLRLSMMTGDPRYLSEVVRAGEQVNWAPGDKFYHADDHAVGHAWLDIYEMDQNHPERLALIKKRFDAILANPPTIDLTFLGEKQTETRRERYSDRWAWCDALFMAPPTLARLHQATGDDRYLEYLESEWRLTHSVLYDPKTSLYFRDTRFINNRLENGKKILWARGNGWVYGGLALTLEKLPKDHSLRPFLEDIFKEMSASLKNRQQSDGLWYPNLDDRKHIPYKESSGTGFFTFGMAWGINNGYLSREDYWPVVKKGWRGLLGCVLESGMLGYVQPVGASPEDNIERELTQVYGTGAFLLAGSEIMKVLGAKETKDTPVLLDAAEAMAFSDKAGEAMGVYQPYRKDDLAWENDKMAFRVYGPALKDSTEDSGIDCWMKSVPTPVIRKWYADDFAGVKSYHKDTGEGYDGYKVGAARGCGGTGIWRDGELETANVYRIGTVRWTPRNEVELEFIYKYPESGISERKILSLKSGDDFCTVTSYFYVRSRFNVLPGMQVAIGLTAQAEGTDFQSSLDNGWMAVWDQLPNGDEIGTGVLIDGGDLNGFQKYGDGPGSDYLAILETDNQGKIQYRMGFTWSRAIEAKDKAGWLRLLDSVAK